MPNQIASLRRPSMKKAKSKKEKKPPKEKTRRRSTKSFKGRAGLVPPPADNDEPKKKHQQPAPPPILKPHLSMASTTRDDVDSDTSSDDNNNNHNETTPLIRGGGYCTHAQLTTEEKWRDDRVELAMTSWRLDEDERAKLWELKERCRDLEHPYLNDPYMMIYFLQDEYFKVDLAEKFLRKIAKVRKESPFQQDEILTEWSPPDDFDYFPICVLEGTDKCGDPIHIQRVGIADCWGLFKRHGRETMIRHALFYQELDSRGVWHDDYERVHKKMVTRFTVIFDLTGLSSRHLRPGLISTCGFVSRLLQDGYPEMVKRVLIIHAPAIFKMAWRLVSHFFEPELRELMIFGTDEADSHRLLETYIDPDVLPHCIHNGGKDGRVARGYEHVVLEGGLIPEEGTYTTPEYTKKGRTRAEEASLSLAEDSNHVTSSHGHESYRNRKIDPINCEGVLKGSFELVTTADQCRARIQLD